MPSNYWGTCANGCGARVWVQPHSRKEGPICKSCRAELRKRTCENCGKEFEAPSSGSKQKYCSNNCYDENREVAPPVEILCNGCGSMFKPGNSSPSKLVYSQRTCSHICAGRVRRGWINGVKPEVVTLVDGSPVKKPPALPSHQVVITLTGCVQCKREFLANSPRQTICSEVCRKQRASEGVVRLYHSNPERKAVVLFSSHARRADKLGVNEIKDREDLIAFLRDRDGDTCKLCCEPVGHGPFVKHDPMMPSIDHVIPLSRGGLHDLGNLQLTHFFCNLSKNNRLESELEVA